VDHRVADLRAFRGGRRAFAWAAGRAGQAPDKEAGPDAAKWGGAELRDAAAEPGPAWEDAAAGPASRQDRDAVERWGGQPAARQEDERPVGLRAGGPGAARRDAAGQEPFRQPAAAAARWEHRGGRLLPVDQRAGMPAQDSRAEAAAGQITPGQDGEPRGWDAAATEWDGPGPRRMAMQRSGRGRPAAAAWARRERRAAAVPVFGFPPFGFRALWPAPDALPRGAERTEKWRRGATEWRPDERRPAAGWAPPVRAEVDGAEWRADDHRPLFRRLSRHRRTPVPQLRPPAAGRSRRRRVPARDLSASAGGPEERVRFARYFPFPDAFPDASRDGFRIAPLLLPCQPRSRSERRMAWPRWRGLRRNSAAACPPYHRRSSWSGSPSRQYRVHGACR
jgi:hypothetical protein